MFKLLSGKKKKDDEQHVPTPPATSTIPPKPQATYQGHSQAPSQAAARGGTSSVPTVAQASEALAKTRLDDSDSDDESQQTGKFTGEIDVSSALKHDPKKKISIDEFDLLRVLGQGSFGKVMLVRKKDNQEIFAMKTLKKSTLLKRNQLLHTKTERYILQNIRHPFIVSLQYAFQTDTKLYMVLDFMGGGELFFWLKKERRFKPDRVRLWSLEILLGLEDLHKRDIIYRDLKPENILVGLDGHIKLTDFGLAKEAITGIGAAGGTKTFAGTPEYLAPEILLNRGHGKAVDWWSLGTLMYEMMAGLPPFYDKNVQRMYQKIMHSELKFPPFMPLEAQDCIGKLLNRNVEERLGSKSDGPEIRAHPFFAVLDANKVLAKEYDPGWKPPQDDVIGNFDTEFTTMRVMDTPVTSSMSAAGHERVADALQNFTYDSSNVTPNN